MPIDPTELTKSIGALGTLDPEQGLTPTLQQVVVAAKQLFEADAAGLMLIDADPVIDQAFAELEPDAAALGLLAQHPLQQAPA